MLNTLKIVNNVSGESNKKNKDGESIFPQSVSTTESSPNWFFFRGGNIIETVFDLFGICPSLGIKLI